LRSAFTGKGLTPVPEMVMLSDLCQQILAIFRQI
jgi:hypothetical protein